MKKAQSMSLETVIIAIIVIIVLVVLVFVFTGKFNVFGKTTKDCSAQGGQCMYSGDPGVTKNTLGLTCPDGYTSMMGVTCKKNPTDKTAEDGICCINVMNDLTK